MCFSIPYKVLEINNNHAIIEGNKSVKTGSEFNVKPGDYIQVLGNIAVNVIPRKDGLKIRRLIKSLNC
jgi:hydrogenase maturation factor